MFDKLKRPLKLPTASLVFVRVKQLLYRSRHATDGLAYVWFRTVLPPANDRGHRVKKTLEVHLVILLEITGFFANLVTLWFVAMTPELKV